MTKPAFCEVYHIRQKRQRIPLGPYTHTNSDAVKTVDQILQDYKSTQSIDKLNNIATCKELNNSALNQSKTVMPSAMNIIMEAMDLLEPNTESSTLSKSCIGELHPYDKILLSSENAAKKEKSNDYISSLNRPCSSTEMWTKFPKSQNIYQNLGKIDQDDSSTCAPSDLNNNYTVSVTTNNMH